MWVDDATHRFSCNNSLGIGSNLVLSPAGAYTSADWTFNSPLPVNTNVTFTKYVTYTGALPMPNLVVAEYPTVPEPAGLLLLAASGLLFIRRR